MDILSQLIEAEIERRVQAAAPAIAWGIWRPGLGWLMRPGSTTDAFATENKRLADQTAAMLGSGAVVWMVDTSLVELEGELLEAERQRAETKAPVEPVKKSWLTFLKSR